MIVRDVDNNGEEEMLKKGRTMDGIIREWEEVHTRGEERKNNGCRKSRCQTFSLSLRSGRTIGLAGHKNETIRRDSYIVLVKIGIPIKVPPKTTSHIS